MSIIHSSDSNIPVNTDLMDDHFYQKFSSGCAKRPHRGYFYEKNAHNYFIDDVLQMFQDRED